MIFLKSPYPHYPKTFFFKRIKELVGNAGVGRG